MKHFPTSNLHWSSLSCVGLLGFLVGLGVAPEIARASMDSGTATLVGAALGAGITVAGSIWGVRYSNRLQAAAFQNLVGQSVLAIRDECYRLLHIAELEQWKDNDDFANALEQQLERLKTAIDIFGQMAPFNEVHNYDARLSIFHLEKLINDHLSAIQRELAWVSDHHTTAVLNNARRNVAVPALELAEACVSAARDLGTTRELPSEEDLNLSTRHLHARAE